MHYIEMISFFTVLQSLDDVEATLTYTDRGDLSHALVKWKNPPSVNSSTLINNGQHSLSLMQSSTLGKCSFTGELFYQVLVRNSPTVNRTVHSNDCINDTCSTFFELPLDRRDTGLTIDLFITDGSYLRSAGSDVISMTDTGKLRSTS
jgi:hypothetical protein